VHVHFRQGGIGFVTGHCWVRSAGGGHVRPDPHYTLSLTNHATGEHLKIELIDLPFPGARSYRIRVKGQWGRKVPVASKTIVAKQLRGWLVKRNS
jgi:hypothetical protein